VFLLLYPDFILFHISIIEKIKKEYTKEKCEKCGAKMEIKHGKFGPFLACSNYPKCKNTKPIIKKIGVKCPKCKEGDIIERKSKKDPLKLSLWPIFARMPSKESTNERLRIELRIRPISFSLSIQLRMI